MYLLFAVCYENMLFLSLRQGQAKYVLRVLLLVKPIGIPSSPGSSTKCWLNADMFSGIKSLFKGPLKLLKEHEEYIYVWFPTYIATNPCPWLVVAKVTLTVAL